MIAFSVNLDLDPNFISDACTAAEKILAVQVMKDTRPFVPAQSMGLNQRTTLSLDERTRTIGSTIVYPGPYARYLYVGKVMVDSVTGKGPRKIPEVGYRFRKGATLRPTSRPLNISTAVHPQAQAEWFEASKKQNMEKWKNVAAKAIETYGK